jgi:glutathione S-transferase
MESTEVSNASEVADAERSTADRVGEYTLYCFAQSGNAYKCALALQLAGAEWVPRLFDYFGGEIRGRAYRDINILG